MAFDWMDDAHWRVQSPTQGAKWALSRRKVGDIWQLSLKNEGDSAATVDEVVVFAGAHGMLKDTRAYGEGSQMLSQYEGTLEDLGCITELSDAGHYHLPTTAGMTTVYNMLLCFTKPAATLYAFSSCNRFVGAIRVNGERLELAQNLEGVVINPGETIALESVYAAEGEPHKLLESLAEKLTVAHPKFDLAGAVPTGWCSWYCFGPGVTAKDIENNMDIMRDQLSELTYVQIDDGYQAYMGDWLTPHPNFGDLDGLLHGIHDAGFEPAIWVAPFIAEGKSKLFTDHPDWFIKDDLGAPLSSAAVSFGGWRNGPWYMLDGTHPGAQTYLEHVFRSFRNEYGIKYFKLDANFWGCMPHGSRYVENATSVEAYRAGMEAVIRGAGHDSVILGCNAPMWSSIGVVNCMRVSNDLSRNWAWSKIQTRECLWRNWQHNRLWVNDPDVVTLLNSKKRQLGGNGEWIDVSTSAMTENELRYHRTAMFATAGMVLVGDDMARYGADEFKLIKKMAPPHPVAAQFADADMRVGLMPGDPIGFVCLFNDTDAALAFDVPCSAARAFDHWTDAPVAVADGVISIELPAHDAMLIRCEM